MHRVVRAQFPAAFGVRLLLMPQLVCHLHPGDCMLMGSPSFALQKIACLIAISICEMG